MASAVTDEGDTTIPLGPDGEGFYACLSVPGSKSVFADTLTEIVARLIPDYPNRPGGDDEDGALVGRVEYLAAEAANLQALVAASAGAAARVFDEDELTAMFTEKSGAAVDVDGGWDDDVPLILVAQNYAPYSPHPRPAGKGVVWLDGADERVFLESVASLSGGALFLKG